MHGSVLDSDFLGTDPPACLKSAVMMLDLPAPVRPTIPIFSLRRVLKFSPFSTNGSVSAYLKILETYY